MPDEDLLELAPGEARVRYARFAPAAARERDPAARLWAVCHCREEYPARLRDLADPPAVLHVLGSLTAQDEAIAVVGARRASSYGLEVATALGRGLSAARVPVVSGLALGVDSAAHAGALQAPGQTIAVLAASAHVAYPARGRQLHAAVAARGAVVSEMPPGAEAHRWCFVARNRIIAALGAATVVVQATERSGSLTTADFAAELGRAVGAVPGPGHDAPVGRHARPDPGRRAADPRRRGRAGAAVGRDRPRLRDGATAARRARRRRCGGCSTRSRTMR